jgi:hypothetical protein
MNFSMHYNHLTKVALFSLPHPLMTMSWLLTAPLQSAREKVLLFSCRSRALARDSGTHPTSDMKTTGLYANERRVRLG